MLRDALGDADTDRGDLPLRAAPIRGHPDAAAPGDARGRHAEVGAGGDERVLDPPHVRHDVEGHGQADDGVAHELAGTVPGDLAAAIDIDDGGAVQGALERLRAPAGGVDGGVLEEEERVRSRACDHIGMGTPLEFPPLGVPDGLGSEPAYGDHPCSVVPAR